MLLAQILILSLAGLASVITLVALIIMLKEFAQLKTAAILMEAAFMEHKEAINTIQGFVSHGLQTAETQYTKVQEDYGKVVDSNHGLQERINKMEANQKKPMAPDVIFN